MIETKIQNYRPVSILNGFSKIYELYLYFLNSLSGFVNKILSNFIAAYRKPCSSVCSCVLIRLIENRKKQLYNKNVVETFLMDLSKTFDCIPHDLLIAKLHAYGFNKNPAGVYLLKVNNRNIRTRCEIFANLL